MGQYVDVADVSIWYADEGNGEPLVLLHGGLCTNETWAAQTPAFAQQFRVIAPERRGHGHTADVAGPLTYTAMVADMIRFLDQVLGIPAHLVGYSDGGIVALMIAISRPDLVANLVVIGANYEPSGLAPGVLDMFAHTGPDSSEMAELRELYERHSPDGPEHWPVVYEKFVELVGREPNISLDELARITAPTLVVAGDDDIVSLEHTVAMFRAIPKSQLAVLPGTSHAVPEEKPQLLNRMVLDFLSESGERDRPDDGGAVGGTDNGPAESGAPIPRHSRVETSDLSDTGVGLSVGEPNTFEPEEAGPAMERPTQ
jgi:pimeloyl-ACP methyl ester carboxylesterase